MKPAMIVHAVVALVLLGAQVPAVTAQTFYRWVDEHGAVHYTQSPPPRLAVPPPAPAAPTPRNAAAVDEVLELSGLKMQLAQLPQHVLAQAPQLPLDLSPGERSAM